MTSHPIRLTRKELDDKVWANIYAHLLGTLRGTRADSRAPRVIMTRPCR